MMNVYIYWNIHVAACVRLFVYFSFKTTVAVAAHIILYIRIVQRPVKSVRVCTKIQPYYLAWHFALLWWFWLFVLSVQGIGYTQRGKKSIIFINQKSLFSEPNCVFYLQSRKIVLFANWIYCERKKEIKFENGDKSNKKSYEGTFSWSYILNKISTKKQKGFSSIVRETHTCIDAVVTHKIFANKYIYKQNSDINKQTWRLFTIECHLIDYWFIRFVHRFSKFTWIISFLAFKSIEKNLVKFVCHAGPG